MNSNIKSTFHIFLLAQSNRPSGVRMGLFSVAIKLALVASHQTVPPIPSHAFFPRLVAKKFSTASIP